MAETVLARIYEALGEEGLRKARWQQKVRVWGLLAQVAGVALFALVMLPTGWAAALRDALGGGGAFGALLVVLALMALQSVFTLPLAWYFGYRVEQLLGTNRQTLSGWLLDYLKQGLLSTVLFGLFFWGVYLVFRAWPTAWLPALAGVVVLLVLGLYLAQPLMVRAQFKAEPLEDEELSARLARVFEKAGFAYGGVSVLRAGEKTARGNAALVPKGGRLEVMVFDTLLEEIGPEGLEVVVAHELGHRAHKDWPWMLGLYGLLFVVGIALAHAALAWTAGRWGLAGAGDPATLPLLLLVLNLWMLVAQVAMNAFMRSREFAADRYALELVPNLEAFERTFVTLARQNLADPEPPEWVEFWLHDHPSIARRLEAARRAVRSG
ncbi:peptidase M48 Ste24p [Oceanithermus profundus DSM 14977]|uniref:Peptidase M48 Ste24p n=1 Tax=Oceanithermus profundus (strain DSM 14977 / NBRC 100410 / VKM B-2274 / 506) TaxID=670487 RepID=E4U5Q9_OCEP5|nr:M48 family metalloprotease [Oceanithermus profundus]ADR35617.1 peptidase M48 Ste24p [Oceanithermus profundus DSM 14977]